MSSRLDDFFDPERLNRLWSGAASAPAPVEPAAEAPDEPDDTAELLARLERALERELGGAAASCRPYLAEAERLCAALPDPGAQAEVLALLDQLEDLLEALKFAGRPGGFRG